MRNCNNYPWTVVTSTSMSSIGAIQNLSGDEEAAVFSCFEGEPETTLKDRLKELAMESDPGDRGADDSVLLV